MKYFNQIGALAAVGVIISCFLTWVIIPDLNIPVTGFATEGTGFGKPGLMNALMSGIAFIMFLLPKVWAKRFNLFFSGFNLAWALRNFILVTTCHGGDCPQRKFGLYLFLFASLLMMAMAMFPKQEIAASDNQ